ncbi:DUF4935 domain-containing protein [Bacillus paralicheniformis]|nr:DUF4935 domain-containing protein [Bacillus paralicheniformis]
MKSMFKEFYFDNKNSEIWRSSIIILDTNVLLNLYRYSNETSEKLLTLLKKSKDRLWLPHQIGLEFHLNRTNVILDQQTSYEKIESILKKQSSEIETNLKKELSAYRKKHVTLSIDSIIEQLKKSINNLVSQISKEKEDHPKLLKNDYFKQQITDIYENKVGSPYDKSVLESIKKEADERYQLEIPPGYKDASKKGVKFYNGEVILEKYGDYILWKQIIDFAKENETNIIFITDDEKEDWWYFSKGKTIGPRSELLNEFSFITGKEFYMFKPEVFMKEAGKIYSEDFSDNTLLEVREVSEESADYPLYMRHGKRYDEMRKLDHLNNLYLPRGIQTIGRLIDIKHDDPIEKTELESVIEKITVPEDFLIEFRYQIVFLNKLFTKENEYDFKTRLALQFIVDRSFKNRENIIQGFVLMLGNQLKIQLKASDIFIN